MDTNNNLITLHTHLTLAEYRKLVFKITYTTTRTICIQILCIVIVVFSLFKDDMTWGGVFFAIFLLYYPFIVYRNASSNYKATKTIHEPVVYEISSNEIGSSGPSFRSSVTWKSLYKTKELDDYFLLYINKQSAMIIPKRDFATTQQMEVFRGYLRDV